MPIKNDSIILRRRLLGLFDELAEERIIYISAPAGYGKTVAVRQWLNDDTRANAVIAFDESDNEPVRFCRRFCTAILNCQPKNKPLAEIISNPYFESAPDEFSVRAIGLLSTKEHYVLVADDLHFITDERVLRLLLIFLLRLPETFQIVLISRNDLPPHFSDLWIKGNLSRIHAEHFLFSNEEIKMMYKNRGNYITTEQADNIFRFTGGWAIGVGALLLSGGTPSGESLEYLEEFIHHSVWEKWDESTREFLICTAMAHGLHPSLCNALAGITDSDKLLNGLMRSGVFIFQSSDGVYHYHHLFQSFLKQKLEERGESYITLLLEKEGEWYLSRKDFYGAVDCFIRCRNCDGISRCFTMQESDNYKEHFIEQFIPIVQIPIILDVADKHPYFFSIMAWAAFAYSRAEDMMHYADLFYERFPEIAIKDPAHAHYIFLMCLIDFRVKLSDIMTKASGLQFLFGAAAGRRGPLAMNMPLLHRGTRDFSEFCIDNPLSNVEMLKNQIGYIFGEEADLLTETLSAGLLYEQGFLDKAHIHALAAAAKIKNHFSPDSRFCALSILICILDALGQSNEADKAAAHLSYTIEYNKTYTLSRNFSAFMCRRKLCNGDTKAAREWLIRHESAPGTKVEFFDIYITFTTCRAYITTGDYDSAIALLTTTLELADIYNRPLDIIEAEILLAISYWKKMRNFQAEGMKHLETAVSLAYGYEYMQIFANEGTEISGMLRRLQKSAEQRRNTDALPTNFIKQLYLKALENPGKGLTSGQPVRAIKFTDKQKAIMKLICEGKSYREITEIIGIKLPTLRSHISLIYKKLDVTGENDAILKIKSLDILNLS